MQFNGLQKVGNEYIMFVLNIRCNTSMSQYYGSRSQRRVTRPLGWQDLWLLDILVNDTNRLSTCRNVMSITSTLNSSIFKQRNVVHQVSLLNYKKIALLWLCTSCLFLHLSLLAIWNDVQAPNRRKTLLSSWCYESASAIHQWGQHASSWARNHHKSVYIERALFYVCNASPAME